MSAAVKKTVAPVSTPVPEPPEDNPISTWLRQNRLFLVLLVGALIVGGLLQQFLPRLAAQNRMASWEEFYEVVGRNRLTSLQGPNLQATLDRLRDDERIFPFAVVEAAAQALSQGDREALRLLEPELVRIEADGTLDDLRLAMAGTPASQATVLLGKVRKELENPNGGLDFTNPEPTGQRVRITIKLDETDTYDIVFGLYPGRAPEACARFLEAVGAGRLDNQAGQFAGVYNLRFEGLSEPEAQALPLEASYGLFHLAGVLSTVEAGAGFERGQQQPAQVALFLQDASFFDGRSSVFGRVVEGQDGLEALQAILPDPSNPTQPAKSVRIQAAEVLP